MTTQNLWDAAKAVLREVYSNTILPQETRKTLNRQPNFTPKTTEKKEEQKKTQKEIIKIQAERNEKEMKETVVKINKTKSCFFEKTKVTSLQPNSSRKKREESNQQNQK